MTEEEAKTRWCPFIGVREWTARDYEYYQRVVRNHPGSFLHPECACLASGCMAWRITSLLDPDDGYCGLAGFPQPRHAVLRSQEDCD